MILDGKIYKQGSKGWGQFMVAYFAGGERTWFLEFDPLFDS